MTTTANPGIHPSQTLRVIRLLQASYQAHAKGDEGWKELYNRAEKCSPDAVAGITGGMRMGEVPAIGTAEWLDWFAIQTTHLGDLVAEDAERVHICEGGPLDGKVYAESKALWPPQNMLPEPDASRTLAWPEALDSSVPRYMPHLDDMDEPIRMVWTTPDQAQQLYMEGDDQNPLGGGDDA